MCVTVLELPGRKRWSNWWHLHALCSRFLSHSPVHQTQHVHDSHMPMIRWCFAGKYSPISGGTACVDCRAGKFQPSAGVESVCVRGRGKGGRLGKKENKAGGRIHTCISMHAMATLPMSSSRHNTLDRMTMCACVRE
jgi:hypothetical protein